MAMEQGAILQHQLPIHDYPLPSEHDYNDQYSGHGSYATSGSGRDNTSSLQGNTPFSFTATNSAPAARFVSDRGVASDSSSYHTTSNFTDHSSSAGSISTSPSSAASSLAYTGYVGQNPCATIPSFAGSVQPFVPAPYANSRAGGMLPPPLTRPSPTDREAYQHSSLLGRTSQSISGNHTGYNSYATETPRSTLFSGLSHYSNNTPSHSMASPPGYGNSESCSSFPWPTLEIHAEMTSEGQAVTPEVHAKVEKGFFLSTVDQKWTCYRRNYFSVQCHFELHPNITNGRMFLKRTNSPNTEQIQAMGMRLSAAVDGPGGKSIELVQHTPKRDNGPKNKIDITKVSPTPTSGRNEHTVSPHGIYQVPMSTFHATGQVPGPFLPLQNTSDPNASPLSSAPALAAPYPYSAAAGSHVQLPGQNTSHTFERVQFKQATANNGKRRASQQYFHLIVELFADVRKENSDTPTWVKVAHRVSEKIVVRGRSPSHYQNEGQHQNGRTGSSGGSSGYSTTAGANYGGLTAGGFRTSSSGYGGGMNGGSYRTNSYAGYHHSPENSGSSASSVDGGAADNDYQPDTIMSEAERNDMQGQEGYRYYPGPIYEGIPPQPHTGLPLPKVESSARYSTDPSQWAVKHEYHEPVTAAPWPVSSITRFQGVESSRGYFPDLASNNYS